MLDDLLYLLAQWTGKGRKHQLKKELQVAFDVQESQRESGYIHRLYTFSLTIPGYSESLRRSCNLGKL